MSDTPSAVTAPVGGPAAPPPSALRPADAPDLRPADAPDTWSAGATGVAPAPAPAPVPLPEASGPRDAVTRLRAHGCWYPSADPDGTEAAFICDRGGVPQLWAGPLGGSEVRLLDSYPDPVKEVSWSPDGRWIAYTTAPGGGEHTRVLCVRPDGSGHRILAGADPDSTAHLGCWAHDGSAVAVTLAGPGARARPDGAGPARPDTGAPAKWAERGGRATLLGGTPYDAAGGTGQTGTESGAMASAVPAARPDG
ncbi:S9 family peptidase, partial [Streptomyces maremycinicus]